MSADSPNVAYWHLTDITMHSVDVCFEGESGRRGRRASISAFDQSIFAVMLSSTGLSQLQSLGTA